MSESVLYTYLSFLLRIDTLTFPRIILRYSPFCLGNDCSISCNWTFRRSKSFARSRTASRFASFVLTFLDIPTQTESSLPLCKIWIHYSNILLMFDRSRNLLFSFYLLFNGAINNSKTVPLMINSFYTFRLEIANFFQFVYIFSV
jgi:hypothetical protein